MAAKLPAACCLCFAQGKVKPEEDKGVAKNERAAALHCLLEIPVIFCLILFNRMSKALKGGYRTVQAAITHFLSCWADMQRFSGQALAAERGPPGFGMSRRFLALSSVGRRLRKTS